MRETPISNCEREFILKALAEKKRIDGRECYDYRHTTVSFGVDRGCCSVQLGKTRVMTQISCEVTPPKQARPSEGILFVNAELSPMAAPHFEAGRPSELGTEISRILERCIKESRCVDTESLCIMAGLKVWTIRVDIHVLNHGGNLMDACSTSAIAALAHFRRPDVTVCGEDVTVHTLEDRDPVPLSVHHMPLCVTFAFYEQGKYLLVDPSEREERVMDGKMVIGMNKHREICTLQMTGSMLLLKDQVLRCSGIAVVKVTETTELIQQALENDARARAAGDKFGFAASIITRRVTAHSVPESELLQEKQDEDHVTQQDSEQKGKEDEQDMEEDSFESKVISKEKNTVTIGDGGKDAWRVGTPDDPQKSCDIGKGGESTWVVDEKARAAEIQAEQKLMWKKLQGVKQKTAPGAKLPVKQSSAKPPATHKVKASDFMDSDDEEESTVTLLGDDVQTNTPSSKSASIDLTSALKSKSGKKTKKQKPK